MGLALVMVEKHAGRAVHLRDNYPLCAIDDKCTIAGHQRHIAHIYILFFDIADRFRAGILVNLPNNQTQGHFQRRGEGQAALLTFFDIIFRGFQLIGVEFQNSASGKIMDRENRSKTFLQAGILAVLLGNAQLQKLIIA